MADGLRTKTIPLSQGLETFVDAEDFERFGHLRWCAATSGRTRYAQRSVKVNQRPTVVKLHRLIMGAQKGQQVDHINGDGLDNRRCNLRVVDQRQNNYNQTRKKSGCTSRFRGVSRHTATNRWQVHMQTNTGRKHLGYFTDEEEAARAYDAAGFERDPVHFTPNFPEE